MGAHLLAAAPFRVYHAGVIVLSVSEYHNCLRAIEIDNTIYLG